MKKIAQKSEKLRLLNKPRSNTSDFQLLTFTVCLPTSDFRLAISTSKFWLPTSGFRLATSNFRVDSIDFHSSVPFVSKPQTAYSPSFLLKSVQFLSHPARLQTTTLLLQLRRDFFLSGGSRLRRSRAQVSRAVALQRKIRDCSQSTNPKQTAHFSIQLTRQSRYRNMHLTEDWLRHFSNLLCFIETK